MVHPILLYALSLAGGAIALAGIAMTLIVLSLRAAQRSLGILPPTKKQLEDGTHDSHALFRHFPALVEKVAWLPLGNFPTPVETGTFKTPDGTELSILVKREDLASPHYAGNKVRTLQHSLGIVQAGRARGLFKEGILALGSSGTNQVVAT